MSIEISLFLRLLKEMFRLNLKLNKEIVIHYLAYNGNSCMF